MQGCPKHGTKFLISDGDGSTYCAAKIPEDRYGLTTCYFTVPPKKGRKKTEICIDCKKNKALPRGKRCRKCKNALERKRYTLKKMQDISCN